MVEPIVLEFKIDDIYIDNPLLSKNDLLKYDTEYCYEKVTKEIDRFIKAQLNFPNIKKPTITCNYEVRCKSQYKNVEKVENKNVVFL